MKFYPMLLLIILGGCAKNSRDIVEDGRTLGSFEPKRDYVVDIPMGESQVVGEASGMKILGLITIGAGKTADGVDAGNRGDSTLGITSSAGSFAGGALAPIMALTSSTSDKFKKANKLKCMFVVVLGEDEIKNGVLQLKNLKTGDQKQLTFEDTIEIIKKKND